MRELLIIHNNEQENFLLKTDCSIGDNVLRLGGRFNAAKPLLYAGTVDLAET
jgi:hypothetical protein